MSGKISFSPKSILFNIIGFSLGLFFCNTIIGFISDLSQTGTPTSDLISSLFINAGVSALIGIVLVIITLLLVKKFIGFIICVFIGIAACMILLGMGVTIPDPASFFVGII